MDRDNRRHRTVMDAQLSKDFLHVTINRVSADVKRSGDALVAVTPGELPEHFLFTKCEWQWLKIGLMLILRVQGHFGDHAFLVAVARNDPPQAGG